MLRPGQSHGMEAPPAEGEPGSVVMVDGERVVIEEHIADGGFGSVYRVRSSRGKTLVLKKMVAMAPETVKQLEKEVELTKKCSHKNIVSCFGASLEHKRNGSMTVYMLLEFCPHGHLLDRLNRMRTPPPSSMALRMTLPVLAALRYLHAQDPAIAHRDLKFENVLVASDGSLRLCDMGSASTHSGPISDKRDRMEQEDAVERFTTPHFRAPEMVDLYSSHPLDERVDIWAFGCLLYAASFLKHPFEGQNNLAILSGRYSFPDSIPADTAPAVVGLIKACLRLDPCERPTATTVGKRGAAILERLRQGEAAIDIQPMDPELPGLVSKEGKKLRGDGAGYVDHPTPSTSDRPSRTAAAAMGGGSRTPSSKPSTDSDKKSKKKKKHKKSTKSDPVVSDAVKARLERRRKANTSTTKDDDGGGDDDDDDDTFDPFDGDSPQDPFNAEAEQVFGGSSSSKPAPSNPASDFFEEEGNDDLFGDSDFPVSSAPPPSTDEGVDFDPFGDAGAEDDGDDFFGEEASKTSNPSKRSHSKKPAPKTDDDDFFGEEESSKPSKPSHPKKHSKDEDDEDLFGMHQQPEQDLLGQSTQAPFPTGPAMTTSASVSALYGMSTPGHAPDPFSMPVMRPPPQTHFASAPGFPSRPILPPTQQQHHRSTAGSRSMAPSTSSSAPKDDLDDLDPFTA